MDEAALALSSLVCFGLLRLFAFSWIFLVAAGCLLDIQTQCEGTTRPSSRPGLTTCCGNARILSAESFWNPLPHSRYSLRDHRVVEHRFQSPLMDPMSLFAPDCITGLLPLRRIGMLVAMLGLFCYHWLHFVVDLYLATHISLPRAVLRTIRN